MNAPLPSVSAMPGAGDLLGAEALALLPADFSVVTFEEALRRECLPLRRGDGQLMIVAADLANARLFDWLAVVLPEPWLPLCAERDELLAALARCESARKVGSDLVGADTGRANHEGSEDISLKRIAEDTSPVVRLVNSTLYEALRQGASDIHLEAVGNGLVVKYRVDGVLVRIGNVQGAELASQAISRIKVLAELDIAERRVPQDGRFRVRSADRDIDFRVSVMPSLHGEDAVLRVLDKEHLTREMSGLTLATLGYDEASQIALRRMACEPYGMLLVTGPTGSGKTTTLYATIGETHRGNEKIITIEDPVEYQLAGVLQIPVNEKKGLTFARGLRSILRHDPDKIMVGEIRDSETAEIAVQSALTGHLVFTTVHANNAFDVIGRFMHMGIDPYNLVAALNVVVAQRLLRVICPACAIDVEPDPVQLAASRVADATGWRMRRGLGCAQCRGSGYRGRKAIAEMLELNDELRELILDRAPLRALKESARKHGFRLLREAGMELVARGETTLEELDRVTFVA
jgi:general secretion pathway protein E